MFGYKITAIIMRKLSYITLFILGLLLGKAFAYITLQKMIASRGGIGMHGFVAAADKALSKPEITNMLICSKLAMSSGQEIDSTNCIKYLIRSEPSGLFNSKRIGKEMVIPF